MKKVTLQVNDAAEKVVVGVLTHLASLADKGQKRTIRIGGDEKVYDGSICEVYDIEVDGQPTSGYTPVIPNRTSTPKTTLPTSSTLAPTPVPTPTPITTPPSVAAAAIATQQGNSAPDSDLEEQVDVIVTDLCEGDGLFTAYDITKEIRNAGVSCRHAKVRRIVHNTYNNGEMDDNYMRSLIFVDSNVQAFVYHPANVDPNVYLGDDADADADADASNVDPLDALD